MFLYLLERLWPIEMLAAGDEPNFQLSEVNHVGSSHSIPVSVCSPAEDLSTRH
jgi:hypothetical protein